MRPFAVAARRHSTWAASAAAGVAASLVIWSAASCTTGARGASPPTPDSAAAAAPRGAAGDTIPGLVPAGYGTLRQEDIALRLSRFSLLVRAMPLDESIIRLLSPDSYAALAGLRESRREAITVAARRAGVRSASVWYVQFFAVERGETRYSPREFIITNVGRDFRPLEVIPLTPGFGEQRLRQNERRDALYVFDGQLDPQQPLTVMYETARNDEWATLLQRIERERALVRSRAAAGRAP